MECIALGRAGGGSMTGYVSINGSPAGSVISAGSQFAMIEPPDTEGLGPSSCRTRSQNHVLCEHKKYITKVKRKNDS